MGKGKCFRCYVHGEVDYSQFNLNIIDMIHDIYKIIKGGVYYEQAVRSKLGVWLKLFIERNEKHPEIRKLIHSTP